MEYDKRLPPVRLLYSLVIVFIIKKKLHLTSWVGRWIYIVLSVILVVGVIIVIKICLDCPGLAPSLCGQTGPSDISTYHVEIVYKVVLLASVSSK